ncbi:MAG: hypothetical protein V4671_11600 [Armatimonadota bacterium]
MSDKSDQGDKPGDRPDQPKEDSAATERLEDWEIAELTAAYGAMPRREICFVFWGGRVALLDCGHRRKRLRVRLRVGESARCSQCFELGMRTAQALIDEKL